MAATKTAATTGAKKAKLSPKDKRIATAAANRKAQLQWWLLGGSVMTVAIVAIVLISIFTEGEIPTGGHN